MPDWRRFFLVLAAGLALAACFTATAQAADPVIASAGDIACASSTVGSTTCHQKATSNLLAGAGLSAVLPLGDNQYDSGSLSAYKSYYDPSWGRVKSITRPVLGNHEGGGTGYFDYFNGSGVNNGPAGERGKGYYSYDVGGWHLIALNSNCDRVACTAGSTQERWLRADLAAHPTACTLAYSHHARFSSGHDGDNTFMQPLWQALYDAGADIVLAGHSHDYERYAPMNATGSLDRARGIREFVVGTGGAFFTGINSGKPNSEVRQNHTYGVLKLTLHPGSYDWQFVPEAGKTFTDSGSEACRGGGTTQPPPAPTATAYRFAPAADARVEQATPGANYGTSTALRTDAGTGASVESFLTFNVSGLTAPVIDANLRLHANTGTADGPSLYTTNTDWAETAINWTNRPGRTSGVIKDLGAIAAGSWAEFDVKAIVTGNGTYAFALAQTSADGVDFESREVGTTSLRPELVVTVDDQPPSAPTGLTATAPSRSRVDLSWTGSTDNLGVTGYDVFRDGSLIATTTGTAYADTAVSAGTTYVYRVQARDAVGNRSAYSNSATVTTPTTETLTFAPQADARVEEASAATNFGTATALRTDGGTDPDVETYLTFNVAAVSGTVRSAKLRLYAFSGTADGPAVYATTSSWFESGPGSLTWSNRPARTSGAQDDKGAIATNSWVEYDVTALVSGNGSYSFDLATGSTDGVDFNSREAASLRPQLVVTAG
jgi:acid phosphatase type 7